jgi:hypothetical protein
MSFPDAQDFLVPTCMQATSLKVIIILNFRGSVTLTLRSRQLFYHPQNGSQFLRLKNTFTTAQGRELQRLELVDLRSRYIGAGRQTNPSVFLIAVEEEEIVG